MDADGEKLRALTQVSATSPTWAPNGKQLCFSSEMLGGGGIPALFVVDVDGKNVRKLTNEAQVSEEPVWAPDGQWIAYVLSQDGSKELYLISAAGGEPRQLTQHPGQEFSPAWVPSALSVSPGSNAQRTLWGALKQTARVNK